MATWTHNITRQDDAIQGGIDVAVQKEFTRLTINWTIFYILEFRARGIWNNDD